MNKLFFGLILFIAIFFRFWQLGVVPASMNPDEAAWGYNAYSIGIDGQDEFGVFLPYKYFESFGDYKPPVYAYLDVLPVKLFGLNEFSVRLPSALFGIFTIIVVYFLIKRLFYNSHNKKKYALLVTFVLAVSSWHINLSRAAFEANVATFLIISGVFFFIYGLQEKKWCLVLSTVLFAVSFYAFNTARIVVPLLVLVLIISFRSSLLKSKKELFISAIIGVAIFLPIVGFLLSSQARVRFNEVNIFSDNEVILRINQEIANDNNAWWSKIIHNRRFTFAVEYLKHYTDHFDPRFLFITGDENHKFSTKDVGILYIWEIPLFILGIYTLIRKKEGYWWFVFTWLFIGIIPAATARETPHALRIESSIPTFQILTALGLYRVMEVIRKLPRKNNLQYAIISFTSLFIIFNILYYAHGYFAHYGRESAGEWNYGYKESISYVKTEQDKYDRIYITRKMGRPYIYYLFYLNIDPIYYRNNAIIERDVFGFVEVKGFGKYRFTDNMEETRGKELGTKKILYITVPQDVPKQARILKTFHLIDGYHRLTAYTL